MTWNGKGSNSRVDNREQYRDNWDKIFGKKTSSTRATDATMTVDGAPIDLGYIESGGVGDTLNEVWLEIPEVEKSDLGEEEFNNQYLGDFNQEWPSENRIDIIGTNGNTGEHYDKI